MANDSPFRVHYNHFLRINGSNFVTTPTKPTPPWQREQYRARLAVFLQQQYELSRPDNAPESYGSQAEEDEEFEEYEEDFSVPPTGAIKLLSRAGPMFVKRAISTFQVLRLAIFWVTYNLLWTPMQIARHLLSLVDWWLVLAFLVGVYSLLKLGNGIFDEYMQEVVELEMFEYVLVQDFQRWSV